MDDTIKFRKISNKYLTPWGHEFGTKAELEAFKAGMIQVSASNQIQNEMMLEKVNYTIHEVQE